MNMVTVIDESGVAIGNRLSEYLHYRSLFVFLTLRDIRLRYRQTVLGVVWAVLQPLLPMLIFSVVFARVLRPQTGGIPYPLFALAGLAPWSFFATAVLTASASFVNSQNLLNKVYFPRAILPAASVTACILDWLVGSVLLLALVLIEGYRPRLEWFFLPLIMAATVCLAVSVGLTMASLCAMFRDLRHLFPFLVQVWMYATPIIYPSSMVPGKLRWALGLNPMAGVVEALRSCLFGTRADGRLIAISAATSAAIALTAVLVFLRLEADLAERA